MTNNRSDPLMAIRHLDNNGRYSKAVIHHDVAYLAGQVAANPVPDVKDQTQQVLNQIDELLSRCGTNKTNLLSAEIFLSDMRHFEQMNQVWDAWVCSNRAPTRTPIEARMASPEFLVEVQVTAAIK